MPDTWSKVQHQLVIGGLFSFQYGLEAERLERVAQTDVKFTHKLDPETKTNLATKF